MSVVTLPHGSVPAGSIRDPAVRDAFMKLNENVEKLRQVVSDLKTRIEALEGQVNV